MAIALSELMEESKCLCGAGGSTAERTMMALLQRISISASIGAPIAPGVVNPEGVVVGLPGQTYYNSATAQLWIKQSGTGSTGWVPY